VTINRSFTVITSVALAIIAVVLLAAARRTAVGHQVSSVRQTARDAQIGTDSPEKQSSSALSQSVAAPDSSNASRSASDQDCVHLAQDYSPRSKLNGQRLPLDYKGLEKGEERRLLSDAKVLPLSGGRLLVGLGDTLYMLDGRRRVQWKHRPSWIIWDFAVVESTGLIYGTGGDNVMFILDVDTGRSLYRNGRNGKAAYGQVVPFGKDMCLITDNFVGYRDGAPTSTETDFVIPDGITAWRGTEALWTLDFPPDADLVVKSDKIYAVTKTDKRIYVREIIPPKTD
jgi:hypothetical protein